MRMDLDATCSTDSLGLQLDTNIDHDEPLLRSFASEAGYNHPKLGYDGPQQLLFFNQQNLRITLSF